MGLDITLYRVVKKDTGTEETQEMFFDSTDEELLNDFKNAFPEEYFHECTEDYLDWDKLGITEETHEFAMMCGSSEPHKSYTLFIDLTHELGIIYKKFRPYLDNMCEPYTISDEDIETLNKYGWSEYIRYGIKVSDIQNNTLTTTDEYYVLYDFITDRCKIKIYMDDVPLYKENGCKILYKEKGYQRKGVVPAFYDDFTPDMEYVFSKDILRNIYNTYISEDRKEYFKKKILDPFINGKHFVHFSW